MKRPNILLITSDQQRADCNGFENKNIKTSKIFDADHSASLQQQP